MIYVDFYFEEEEDDRREKYILTKNININALCLYYQFRNTIHSNRLIPEYTNTLKNGLDTNQTL